MTLASHERNQEERRTKKKWGEERERERKLRGNTQHYHNIAQTDNSKERGIKGERYATKVILFMGGGSKKKYCACVAIDATKLG